MSDTDSILGLGISPGVAPAAYSAPTPYQPPASSGGYGGQSGGYQPNKLNMIKEEDPTYPTPPIFAVSFYLNKGVPPEIIDRVKAIMGGMAKTKFSIRYKITGDPAIDIPIYETVNGLHLTYTTAELILPWKDFAADMLPQSPHAVRTGYGAKRTTAALIDNWIDTKPAIRSFKSAETHLVLGKTGSSPCVAILTWSKDGSERLESLTDETKFNKHVYRIARMYNIPILNLRDSEAINRLERRLAEFPVVK